MAKLASTSGDIEALRAAIEGFIAYIGSLPADALAPAAVGQEWGPREVLCHLVFWHEENASLLAARLRGERRAPVSGGVHQSNARAIALTRDASIEQLCERWQAAQSRVEALLAADLPAGLRMAARQGSTVRPVADVFKPGHVLGHLRQLQRRKR